MSRSFDRAILVVYAVILVVGIAYGLTISVISIHLADRYFKKESMGALASVFALGIVTLSLPSGWVNRKLTPKRTLVGCLLGYAVCVLVFPMLGHFRGVAIARFFDGAFSVGVWVSCETILLFHAERAHKAFVMSLYAMSIALGYILGPILSKVVVVPLAGTSAAFVCAAGLAVLAAVIAGVGLPLEEVNEDHGKDLVAGEEDHIEDLPHEVGLAETPLGTVLSRIRTSCFATFAYGYFQASVVIFLPLFLIESKGVEKEKTIYVTAFFAAGMLLFSNVAARIGDRYGHLVVMRVLATVGAATIGSFVLVGQFWLMCAGVFIAGATLATISPVSLALQGVVTRARDLSRANAFYNAFYAAGMLVGPPISSVLFAKISGAAMIFHLAGLFFLFAAFTWVYRNDDPARRKANWKNVRAAL
jgi:MFS family permease